MEERQRSQTITLWGFVVAASLSVFPLSLTAQMRTIHNPPPLLADFHSQPVCTPVFKLVQAKITRVGPLLTKGSGLIGTNRSVNYHRQLLSICGDIVQSHPQFSPSFRHVTCIATDSHIHPSSKCKKSCFHPKHVF